MHSMPSTATVKNDIILMQLSNHPLAVTPDILPHPAQYFLLHACGLSMDTVLQCWAAPKDILWCSDEMHTLL